VLHRETVPVPAGPFDAVVRQPIIGTKGIFSEGNQVRAWLSNDDRRVLRQLRSRLPIGSLNLYLTSANTAPPRPTRGSTATESRAAPLPAT